MRKLEGGEIKLQGVSSCSSFQGFRMKPGQGETFTASLSHPSLLLTLN